MRILKDRRRAAPPAARRTETVECRDEAGRRSLVTIGLRADGRITLTSPHGDTAVLPPIGVGRLRNCLRAAVIASADVRDEHPAEVAG
uniref:hypothetical protein n=1 Tax=Amycolatopsis sp. CA-151526 TaxID=3239921 RepID=UPI003F4976FD